MCPELFTEIPARVVYGRLGPGSRKRYSAIGRQFLEINFQKTQHRLSLRTTTNWWPDVILFLYQRQFLRGIFLYPKIFAHRYCFCAFGSIICWSNPEFFVVSDVKCNISFKIWNHRPTKSTPRETKGHDVDHTLVLLSKFYDFFHTKFT